MKKTILFVDDQKEVLEGLRDLLRNMPHYWEIAFAQGSQEALKRLSDNGFDMVIADLRMPGMDGCQFLTKVQKLYPHMARIILSEHSDRDMILKSVRVAHQFLAKPCDAGTLQATIARAFALHEILSNDAVISVVSRIETLPTAPAIYQELAQELSSPNASIQRLTEIISRDFGITAKILQLANSAFFGLYQHVSTIERALTLLGFDTVAALVLTAKIFSAHSKVSVPGFSISVLWGHSMATACAARAIAAKEGQERSGIQDAFMGGVLHDIGKLVLAASLSNGYRQVIKLADETHCPLWKAEQEVFATTHAEVGAYLMGLWGIPGAIIEAIAFHHTPNRCPTRTFSPLTATHAANALAHSTDSGDAGNPPDLLNLDYLTGLHLSDRLPVWEAACKSRLEQGGVDG